LGSASRIQSGSTSTLSAREVRNGSRRVRAAAERSAKENTDRRSVVMRITNIERPISPRKSFQRCAPCSQSVLPFLRKDQSGNAISRLNSRSSRVRDMSAGTIARQPQGAKADLDNDFVRHCLFRPQKMRRCRGLTFPGCEIRHRRFAGIGDDRRIPLNRSVSSCEDARRTRACTI
jgi:hypothetical protein